MLAASALLALILRVMTTVWHGPAAWEDTAPRRYALVGRAAVISDVHVSVAALTAVLANIDPADAAEKIIDLLTSPPSPGEIMTEAERLVFSG